MSIENHITEFLEALNGCRGEFDAWLEVNDEAECKAAIFGAISLERERCAKIVENEGLGFADDDEELNRIAALIRST